MWHCFFLRLCRMENKVCGVGFYCFFSISVLMLIKYFISCASSLVFCLPMWYRCRYFSALSFSDADTIIFLPFVAFSQWVQFHPWMSSMAAVPSVPLLLLNAIHRIHTLTEFVSAHCLVLPVLSSAFMQLGICMHDVLMVMHIPGISSPRPISWLCLDGQSTMNSSGPDLYGILV